MEFVATCEEQFQKAMHSLEPRTASVIQYTDLELISPAGLIYNSQYGNHYAALAVSKQDQAYLVRWDILNQDVEEDQACDWENPTKIEAL